MANKGPRILLQGVLLENFIDTLLEWEDVAKERWEFKNWKRSPVERENRRESIVFGNCLGTVQVYLGRRKVLAMMKEAREKRERASKRRRTSKRVV